ncbi:hypothetical protein T440DRAFT_83883 [Plenodomus tracheiphilus IPT5]|uniref:Uncharacterized protein n=1 Tax=Plenodomus tracheiphilus IPT5 TaxID=1408161 RepID=A0A6A7B8P2_9PLEO|nr:hypothetical protein T440DRAFT_83883 [Plenodomus tracheiphilus IPT5]
MPSNAFGQCPPQIATNAHSRATVSHAWSREAETDAAVLVLRFYGAHCTPHPALLIRTTTMCAATFTRSLRKYRTTLRVV